MGYRLRETNYSQLFEDFQQYNIAPEVVQYCLQEDRDPSLFDAGYFERVVYKLASSKQMNSS